MRSPGQASSEVIVIRESRFPLAFILQTLQTHVFSFKMLNKYSKVGIAQISLSVCILILLKFAKHQNEAQRLQKALIPLVFFSLRKYFGVHLFQSLT
jgi:hypothetical protein